LTIPNRRTPASNVFRCSALLFAFEMIDGNPATVKVRGPVPARGFLYLNRTLRAVNVGSKRVEAVARSEKTRGLSMSADDSTLTVADVGVVADDWVIDRFDPMVGSGLHAETPSVA